MQVEVDQSGRNDKTDKDTVLAMANARSYSILISASEKRRVLASLRKLKPRWSRSYINVTVFATLVYLLLRDHIEKLEVVAIDQEYPGHEPLIKDWVMRMCRRQGIAIHKDQIYFDQVGKKSPAHKLAWGVYNKHIKPDKVVTADDVLREFGE